MLLLVLVLIIGIPMAAKDPKPDARLKEVRKIFVAGNNQAAEEARKTVLKEKTCFTLAGKGEDADATLDLADSSTADPGSMGQLGRRNSVVSGTVTLKSGELVWSHSERWGDTPFLRSGSKTAGDLLVRRLAKDAGCKDEKK